jgi:hypothetical protein
MKCKCKGNCKCKKTTNKLILGKVKEAIKKIIRKELDEMTGTSAVAGFATPYAFGNRGKKIATSSLPGFKVTGKSETGTLEEKSKEKTKIVPVGKEKSPDVVKGPKSRGVQKDDLYILKKRRAIAATKKTIDAEKDVAHYDALIGLAKKKLGTR